MQLDLNTSWSIGEVSFTFVCAMIREKGATHLLEFGSGASTIRWALEFSDLSIVSIEHDVEHYQRTLDAIDTHRLKDRVRVQYAPLTFRWVRMRPFLTYSFSDVSERFDFVVIDGPPWPTRRGREACLYLAEPLLNRRATVVLDDSARKDEARVVRNWQKGYGSVFSFRSHDIGHGLTVLDKNEAATRPRLSLTSLVDSYWTMIQILRARQGGEGLESTTSS
jgi:predicted O-methyltransferase YrrM